MPNRKRRNPQPFTTDEIRTADGINMEGHFGCFKVGQYTYPAVTIEMCAREALEPASRVFGTAIYPDRRKRIVCPPHLFLLDGRGVWRARTVGSRAEDIGTRLMPLLTPEKQAQYQRTMQKCGTKPIRRYRRKCRR